MSKKIVPILEDDDQDRIEELDRNVRLAEAAADKARITAARGLSLRIGDADPVVEADAVVAEAKAEFDAFLDEAAKRGEEWVLSSIGHGAFRDLLKNHPARTTIRTDAEGQNVETVDPEDEGWGVNTDTFPEALLLFADHEDADHRTVAELKVKNRNIAKDPSAVQRKARRLSAGQLEALWTAAFILNKRGVTDPKFARFSMVTQRSNET